MKIEDLGFGVVYLDLFARVLAQELLLTAHREKNRPQWEAWRPTERRWRVKKDGGQGRQKDTDGMKERKTKRQTKTHRDIKRQACKSRKKSGEKQRDRNKQRKIWK